MNPRRKKNTKKVTKRIAGIIRLRHLRPHPHHHHLPHRVPPDKMDLWVFPDLADQMGQKALQDLWDLQDHPAYLDIPAPLLDHPEDQVRWDHLDQPAEKDHPGTWEQ